MAKKEKESGLTAEQQYNLVCKRQMEAISNGIKENTDITKEQGTILKEVEKKVNNGYGTAIAAVNTKLDREIEENAIAHRELKKTISGVMKFVAGALISIFVVLVSILGSVWVINLRDTRAHLTLDHSIQGSKDASTGPAVQSKP